MAIFAVGEGWTGALTRRNVLRTIPGHFDEEISGSGGGSGGGSNETMFDGGGGSPWSFSSPTSSASSSDSSSPVMIYPNDDVQQAAVGWGTTAFVDSEGSVHLVGRPHDVVSLLRMNRMPRFIQRWINGRPDVVETTPVGSAISSLIGWATGVDPEEGKTWEVARQYSSLHDWTRVTFGRTGTGSGTATPTTTAPTSDARITSIACGPGFMALVGSSGSLYTMGINSRGQCGIGTVNNNVWIPQLVQGLTLSKDQGAGTEGGGLASSSAEQDQPIVQVALGFQHGYALSRDTGQVFSWGKANRGQLGRDVNSDQDPLAGPIRVFDPADPHRIRQRVVEIGAGHHHGALLTESGRAYVWGKNMGRPKGNEPQSEGNAFFSRRSEQRPFVDAVRPEPVGGLPAGVRVVRISCGSHHTAMLLEDGSVHGVGVASDEPVALLDAVELIPAGVLELPLRQFEAHHDRTTVIDNGGMVYQVHLWRDETLREYAYFTPPYVEALWDMGHTVQSIHRGWRHTIIVTTK